MSKTCRVRPLSRSTRWIKAVRLERWVGEAPFARAARTEVVPRDLPIVVLSQNAEDVLF